MSFPYPLQFHPRLIHKMWGGRMLAQVAGKRIPPGSQNIGESWELFDFPPGTTGPDAIRPTDNPADWISATIANGPLAGTTLHQLMLTRERDILGDAQAVETPFGRQFPLLIKFLDARQDLSVQVHPTVEYAAKNQNAFVKNEAWHILQHDPGARLLLGAKDGVTPDQFRASLADATTESLICAVPVNDGETYYMPSGTLHALGGGIVAYEVQTPSDTTYRVFDFNRVDPSTGKPRTLHVQQAMDCIQWKLDAMAGKCAAQPGDAILARAPQWTLKQLQIPAGSSKAVRHESGPVVATLVNGNASMESDCGQANVRLGETVLLPPCRQTRIGSASGCRVLLASVPPVEL
jgi:mannose-6-phosphate isomerase